MATNPVLQFKQVMPQAVHLCFLVKMKHLRLRYRPFKRLWNIYLLLQQLFKAAGMLVRKLVGGVPMVKAKRFAGLCTLRFAQVYLLWIIITRATETNRHLPCPYLVSAKITGSSLGIVSSHRIVCTMYCYYYLGTALLDIFLRSFWTKHFLSGSMLRPYLRWIMEILKYIFYSNWNAHSFSHLSLLFLVAGPWLPSFTVLFTQFPTPEIASIANHNGT